MDLLQFRIHPSVGMARFGNSPNWYFIGPEFPRFMQEQFEKLRHRPMAKRHPNAPPLPSGSPPPPDQPVDGDFRDRASPPNVVPQAARFRIFAYAFNVGSREPYRVVEVTSADADIEWTVTLANRKTVRSATDAVEVNQPDPVKVKTNPVTGPFECVSSNPDHPSLAWVAVEGGTGRLLVIGNEGADSDKQTASTKAAPRLFQYDWFDSAADGSVTAVVKPKASFLSRFAGYKYLVPGQKDAQDLPASGTVDAVSAWVVVNMPDYVPDFGHFISLWDLALAQSYKQVVDGKVSAVDGRHFLATTAAELNDYAFYDYHTHIHPLLTVFTDVNYTSGQTRNASGQAPDLHGTGIEIGEKLSVGATAADPALKCDAQAALRLQAAALMDPTKTIRTFAAFNIVLTPVSSEPFAAGHEIVSCTQIADDGTLTVTRSAGAKAWPGGTSFLAAPKGTYFEAKLKTAAAKAHTVLEVEPVSAHKMRQPTTVAGDLNDGPFFIAITDGAKIEWVKCTGNDKRNGKLTVARAQFGTPAEDWTVATATLIAAGGGHKPYDARKNMNALAKGARSAAHKRVYERMRLPRTVYERTTFKTLVGSGTTGFPRQYGRRYDITGAAGVDTLSGDPANPFSMIPNTVNVDPQGSLSPHFKDPRFSGKGGHACKGDDMGTGETRIRELDDLYWIVTERDMPMLKEYAVTQIQFDQFQYWATGTKPGASKLRWAPLFGVLFEGTPIGAYLKATHTADEYFNEFAKRLPRYTPAMLDMANLGKMLGGSFLPGIEVGREGGKASNWSLTHGATKYFPDIRFHPATGTTPHPPGMLTKDLAVPWFNDYISCDETYWPTSRPQVVYQEQGFAYQWLLGIHGGPDYWKEVGFIRRGPADTFIEKERLLTRP